MSNRTRLLFVIMLAALLALHVAPSLAQELTPEATPTAEPIETPVDDVPVEDEPTDRIVIPPWLLQNVVLGLVAAATIIGIVNKIIEGRRFDRQLLATTAKDKDSLEAAINATPPHIQAAFDRVVNVLAGIAGGVNAVATIAREISDNQPNVTHERQTTIIGERLYESFDSGQSWQLVNPSEIPQPDAALISSSPSQQ